MAPETRSARPGSARTGDPGPSVRAAQQGIFRKEGEYWTVGYGGKPFRLKDTKGLGYLAHLLRHPAAEFHVLDLVGWNRQAARGGRNGQSVQGLPRGKKISKGQGFMSPTWATPARCSTTKPRSPTDAGSPNCATNWKKPRSFGKVERAEQAEEEIDCADKGTLARRGTRWT